MQAIIRAAKNVNSWGRWAAVRHIVNKTGYNEATARRCLTVAMLCEAAAKIN